MTQPGLPTRLPVWVAWHFLTALGIALLGSVRFQVTLWALPRERALYVGALVLAYLAGAVGITWRARRGQTIRVHDAILAVAMAFGLLSFGLLLTGSNYSRVVLVAAFLFALLLIPLSLLLGRNRDRLLLPVLGLGVVGLVLASGAEARKKASAPQVITQFIPTTFYDLVLEIEYDRLPSRNDGGALETLDEGLLAATGDGALYFLSDSGLSGLPSGRQLPYHIPLNLDEFEKAAPDSGSVATFRVADLLVRQWEDTLQLFASHHYWLGDAGCIVLRVSELTIPRDAFLEGRAAANWTTLHDTRPCLPLKTDTAEAQFSGHESGGRMAFLADRALLLTVGDHAFDGVNSEEALAQDRTAEYGKTLRIDTRTGEARVYSLGHRNPQGLTVTPEGEIWLTEHGPKGGDELNRVVRGANYGWPFVTYGAEYDERIWPLSASQGRHPGYEKPVFAWVPSIGISNLISVQGDLFPEWRGDLLISSLGAQRLFRVRMEDGKARLLEPIPLPGRIRDLTETRDGRFVLLFDGGGLGVIAPANTSPDSAAEEVRTGVARGQLLFGSCRPCHSLGAVEGQQVGIDLQGIVGREIAAQRGYQYSPALSMLSGRWTEERLDRFLENPAGVAPGTSMRFAGMPDPAARAALIAYLKPRR